MGPACLVCLGPSWSSGRFAATRSKVSVGIYGYPLGAGRQGMTDLAALAAGPLPAGRRTMEG